MATLNVSLDSAFLHPLDTVEQLVIFNEWSFDRRNHEEMAVQVPGTWCNYSLYFAWNGDMEAMHFTCAFDIRIAEEKREQAGGLLAAINEKLWLGHFGYGEKKGFLCSVRPYFCGGIPA